MKATTSKTESKTIKTIKPTAYAYGEFRRTDYISRFNAVDVWVLNSRESLDSRARDMKAQIVFDMRAEGMTETQIAKTLNVSKQEVAKLVIRATANAYGLDGTSAVELVNQPNNGITKVAIESIVKQGMKDKATRAEIAEKLETLGLATKEAKTREPRNAGGTKPTKESRTAKAIALIEKIAKQAEAGQLLNTQLLDKLEDVTARIVMANRD